MSKNIDDDSNEDERKIKVVKLRKKVVKVVAHTDRNLNKFRKDFVESSSSSSNQGSNKGYSYGNRDRVGGGVRPSSLQYTDKSHAGGGHQQGHKGPFNRTHLHSKDNRGYSYGNRDRVGGGVRPSSLQYADKSHAGGGHQQGHKGPFNKIHTNSSSTTGSQTFRRVIRTKIVSSVAALSPADSDNKGLNRKLGEKKKQQQESQKGYKRKKEEIESKTIEQKVFDQLQKKKKENLANPIPKSIDIMGTITVSELARKMNLKSSDLIAKLMTLGVMVTINEKIDSDTATILVEEYGAKVNVVSIYDETVIEIEKDDESKRIAKPPIITIMGHVDHGKTKLLSVLQNIDINQTEFGGITQHIGAYTINYNDHEITFLDTPGHEAFTMMRSRGAQVTDIVVLVVSAVDGVMPQTIEAINHAKDAKVPIIVAINKIDLPDSNLDKVKHQLSEYDLVPEDWGGNTIFVAISALKSIGITELLDMIILQAEVMSLKANPTKRAIGRILDAKVDLGRGIVCSVIIEDGTLFVGDSFVGGVYHGKVRALVNERGVSVKSVGPAKAISVLGFSSIPQAGDPFQVTKTEKEAKLISSKRQDLKKYEDAKNVKKVTVSNLYDSIKDGGLKELKIILKADVQGSVEALKHSLEKLTNDEIKVKVIHSSVGAITETDISFAAASEAIMIGFHVRPTAKAQLLADQEKVEIRKYNIIYDAINSIKSVLEGMLEPDIEQQFIGFAEVRDVINLPKVGVVAGCYVSQGCIKRDAITNVMREGFQVHSGKISSLKRFKEDVKEVNAQYECGIMIDNYSDIKEGDIIEAFEIKKVKRRFNS
ncbi:translation initiation factor IF-2 [Borrelia miyamotoi]|uniref:Translation initiation factor IF-2 n=1 Tax=Borrelia miyamotoi TaxID=47466 RepID=A0AAP9CF94_9SPIR|nr:translation initiation factor IF-2 [Borrelia miyamotoi]ATQ14467.1 translation initiation factor IF-2 [Borrelia miyamotoi]ATQ15652.1 translation initiation factor IF-2 [Borrelia miyamotoi]ATQ16796.1 translation initiation factor IF-2 [Borrelia miyamotoi]ATQ18701.1 translation initiation factor IF-2 [Borrelia miyamotoi]ATQ19293.1 translation initiation factor IF-2 [Borrelia miyamotoi]